MSEQKKEKTVAVMLPRLSKYGGVEQYAYRVAAALAECGYKVDFICARQEVVAPEGIRVRSVGRFGGFKFLKMLWFLVVAEQLRKMANYDVTISFGKTWNQDISRTGGGPLEVFWRLSEEAWPAGMARETKRLSRLLQPANWLTLMIERHTYTHTPHIVAISDLVRQWVLEVYPHLGGGSADDKDAPPVAVGQELHTIYNCPDVSRFHAPSPEERERARLVLGAEADWYAIGVATTNFALKGVAQLIEALCLLPADVHLYVAGGRKPGKYLSLAKKLHVGNRVHFLGKVTDMQQFYHGLDMFVLPTFYDTLGNVVLEALQCGVKTLCSNRAGAMSFLPDECIIRDPSDPKEIAGLIRQLRASPTLPALARTYGSGVPEILALVEKVIQEKERRN